MVFRLFLKSALLVFPDECKTVVEMESLELDWKEPVDKKNSLAFEFDELVGILYEKYCFDLQK